MKNPREWLNGLRWRLAATRRLWSADAEPDMPFLAPEPFDTAVGEVDAPEPRDIVAREMLEVRGWLVFPSGQIARVEVWLGEAKLGRARIGVARPDVAKLTDDPRATAVGFTLVADIGEWDGADGETVLRVIATNTRGERHEFAPVPVTVSTHEAEREGASIPPPAPRTPRPSGGGGRRVLVSTHQLNLGGAQLYLLDLIRELLKQGSIEPTVVSAMDGSLRADLEALGIPVHISSFVPMDDLSSHIGRVEELAAWAADRDFELVFVNTATALAFPGAEAAQLLGIPAVWAIHESFPPPILWANLSGEIRERAVETLAGAATVLFEAEATRLLFESTVGAERGLVLPYGLDLEPIDSRRAGFDRDAARRKAGIPVDAEVAVCIGTVEPRKAQLALAQAFDLIADRHPHAHLVFVGGRDDLDSEALSDYIGASGVADRIELIPVTPDVAQWNGISDLLVCASDIESLPRTVLEAMAWERPVLATDVFGLPELIDDGETGWLCEPCDTMAMAAALDRALSSSSEERERIGRAARDLVVGRHSLPDYAAQVARLLDRAIVDSRGVPKAETTRS